MSGGNCFRCLHNCLHFGRRNRLAPPPLAKTQPLLDRWLPSLPIKPAPRRTSNLSVSRIEL
jgi:hypothetical protein